MLRKSCDLTYEQCCLMIDLIPYDLKSSNDSLLRPDAVIAMVTGKVRKPRSSSISRVWFL